MLVVAVRAFKKCVVFLGQKVEVVLLGIANTEFCHGAFPKIILLV